MMEFNFKDYIENMGFEQTTENEKVFHNSTYDVKVKFIHHNKNVVLTDPKRRMPKIEHPYPVSFKEAEGILIPYLNMESTREVKCPHCNKKFKL